MKPATVGFLKMAFVYAVGAVLGFTAIAFWYGDTFH